MPPSLVIRSTPFTKEAKHFRKASGSTSHSVCNQRSKTYVSSIRSHGTMSKQKQIILHRTKVVYLCSLLIEPPRLSPPA